MLWSRICIYLFIGKRNIWKFEDYRIPSLKVVSWIETRGFINHGFNLIFILKSLILKAKHLFGVCFTVALEKSSLKHFLYPEALVIVLSLLQICQYSTQPVENTVPSWQQHWRTNSSVTDGVIPEWPQDVYVSIIKDMIKNFIIISSCWTKQKKKETEKENKREQDSNKESYTVILLFEDIKYLSIFE